MSEVTYTPNSENEPDYAEKSVTYHPDSSEELWKGVAPMCDSLSLTRVDAICVRVDWSPRKAEEPVFSRLNISIEEAVDIFRNSYNDYYVVLLPPGIADDSKKTCAEAMLHDEIRSFLIKNHFELAIFSMHNWSALRAEIVNDDIDTAVVANKIATMTHSKVL